MKTIITVAILALGIASVSLTGCAASEPEVQVPVGKPGDGGPQPTAVQEAGGGGAGTTQTPSTE